MFVIQSRSFQIKRLRQILCQVVRGGAADRAGLKDDDIVVEVNGVNVEQSSHNNVVEMIRTSGDSLELLVAERSVYKELKKKGVIITRLLLEDASYVQVHSANNSRPDTPTEGPRERVRVHFKYLHLTFKICKCWFGVNSHFGPDSSISTRTKWIGIKFC